MYVHTGTCLVCRPGRRCDQAFVASTTFHARTVPAGALSGHSSVAPLDAGDRGGLAHVDAQRDEAVLPGPGELRGVQDAAVRLPPCAADVQRAPDPLAQLVLVDLLDLAGAEALHELDLFLEPLTVLLRCRNPQEAWALVLAVERELVHEIVYEPFSARAVLVSLECPALAEAESSHARRHADLGHRKAGVATARTEADRLGLKQRDPQPGVCLLDEVRGGEPGVAAADDGDVYVERSLERGGGLVRSARQPEALVGEACCHESRTGRRSRMGHVDASLREAVTHGQPQPKGGRTSPRRGRGNHPMRPRRSAQTM